VGGRGGGKDDLAQGGGTDASRIDEARAAARATVARATGDLRDASSLGSSGQA
jgi:alanyl-tRNA synthetase